MGAGDYAPLRGDEEQAASPALFEEEAFVRKSARWVYFLCFVQFVISTAAMLAGSFFLTLFASIFISFGIVGAAKQRYKLVLAHFVFSVMLYVLTVLGTFFLILFCQNCTFTVFVVGIVLTFLQGVGVRHSRVLVALLKMRQQRSSPVELGSVSLNNDRASGQVNISQSLIALPADSPAPPGYVPVGMVPARN